MKTRSLTLWLVASGSILATLSACSNGSSPLAPGSSGTPTSKATPKSQLSQAQFASCDALKDYYSDALAEEYFTGYANQRNCFGCDPVALQTVDFAESSDTAAPTAAGASAPSNREVTQTNTQEIGVDEADIIETNPNGTEIYVLRRFPRELLVIETADPANPRILSRTPLSGSRDPRGMFFDVPSQRLAIILDQSFYCILAPAVSDAAFAPSAEFRQGTQIQFFDVSNPAAPRALEEFTTDGYFVDARRIGSRLHLVTQFGFPYPAGLQNDPEFEQLAYRDYPQAYRRQDEAEMARLEPQIRARIRDAVAMMTAAELLPEESTNATGEQTLDCTAVLRPEVKARLGLLLISSIDTDGSALSTLGTINNAWQVYASENALYLLQHSGGWWFDPDQRQQTAIYRFDLSTGNARPGAVGLVDGWVNNSYQLSEYQDHLRVAATEGRYAGPNRRFTQHNHLTVLATGSMNQTAQIADFVSENKQEVIRAVRFLGDKGYVVTFEFTDPLFAFELSNPNQPRLAGQIEIPGFSTYIHPLGTEHLLTIGRAGGVDGQGTGNSYQLQIFDVSRLDQPVQLATASPALGPDDYAFSLAEYDPHAFTFAAQASATTGLLSIPVQIGARDVNNALSGFVAYRIDVAAGANAISEYARIDHKDEPQRQGEGETCPSTRTAPQDGRCSSFAPVIYNEPLRSVIIRESGRTTLLTLSSAKLKSLDASATTAQDLATLPLAE